MPTITQDYQRHETLVNNRWSWDPTTAGRCGQVSNRHAGGQDGYGSAFFTHTQSGENAGTASRLIQNVMSAPLSTQSAFGLAFTHG